MECPFQVGDEVVCVDAQGRDHRLRWLGLLTVGAIYQVSAIIETPAGHPGAGSLSVCLAGVPNICKGLGVEIGFRPDRFRKVQKPRTTVEQFTRVPVPNTDRWDKSRRRVPA